MSLSLVAERPEHAAQIERVLDRAFGPGRFAKTSERVRERGAAPEPALTRVALDPQGDVIGVCRIWRVAAAGGAPLYFLGPLAVDPAAQHAGLGADLVRAALAACRAAARAGGVVLVGTPAFFKPFGFAQVPEGRLAPPGPVDPERFLWAKLASGGLAQASGAISAPTS